MKKELIKKIFKTNNALLSLCLVFALLISGTYAFLTDRDDKTNIFSVGEIHAAFLTNTDLNNNGTIDTGESALATNNTISPLLYPSQTLLMQPYIQNAADSSNAFAYIEIGMPKTSTFINNSGTISSSASELFSITDANTGSGNDKWTLIASDNTDSNYNYYLYAYNSAVAADSATSYLFNSVTVNNYNNGMKVSAVDVYSVPVSESELTGMTPSNYTYPKEDSVYEFPTGWYGVLNDVDNSVYEIDLDTVTDKTTSINDIVYFTYNGKDYGVKDLYPCEIEDVPGKIFYSITPPVSIRDSYSIEINSIETYITADIPEAGAATASDKIRYTEDQYGTRTYQYKSGNNWYDIDIEDDTFISYTLSDTGPLVYPVADSYIITQNRYGDNAIRLYWDEDYADWYPTEKFVFVSDGNGENVKILGQYNSSGSLDNTSITSVAYMHEEDNVTVAYSASINGQGNVTGSVTQNAVAHTDIYFKQDAHGEEMPYSKNIIINSYVIQADAYTSAPGTTWTQAVNSSSSGISPVGNYVYS